MPVALSNLNKIDPVIVNNVQQQTAEGVVHTSEKTRVSKDTEREKGSQSNKRMKEKLQKFSSLLVSMDILVDFMIDNDAIIAVDKNGHIVRSYTMEEIEELFKKMEDMIGVFIDIRR